jgi:hypothetical protein
VLGFRVRIRGLELGCRVRVSRLELGFGLVFSYTGTGR